MTDGNTSEAGVVGNREMVGINAFMGGRETTQTEYVTQVTGRAVRMPADIHPFQQMSSRFSPDRHTAAICLQVLKAAIASLSGQRAP